MKQESKPLMEAEGQSLTPMIHVGQIVNPNQQTISIVIPLAGELSRSFITTEHVASGKEFLEAENKETATTKPDEIDMESRTNAEDPLAVESSQTASRTPQLAGPSAGPTKQLPPRADKTKGCPFPTCSRYGRAFSRAHDLKRHIARHETRKERLVETSRNEIRMCSQCGQNFLNETILQRHEKTVHAKQETGSISFPILLSSGSSIVPTTSLEAAGTAQRIFSCRVCKKKFISEGKLKEHVLSHKKSEKSVCTLCGLEFDQEEKLQNHVIREHTSNGSAEKSAEHVKVETIEEDDDDGFMLEEMLLLNKNPRLGRAGSSSSTNSTNTAAIEPSTSSSGEFSTQSTAPAGASNNKIRCDYCSKTFKTKWTLSSHVAAHEGRFQFVCTRCGKKFVRKSHFEGHVRSHEAARPYDCEQCGKTFKELKHRREHTKRKHPGNQSAIQNLLDSISACVSEESSNNVGEQAKFTLLMPINFGT